MDLLNQEEQRRATYYHQFGESQGGQRERAMLTQAERGKTEDQCDEAVRPEQKPVFRSAPLVPMKQPPNEKRQEADEEQDGDDSQTAAQQIARFGRQVGRAAFDQG